MNRKHAKFENLLFTAFSSHTSLYTARKYVVFTVHVKKILTYKMKTTPALSQYISIVYLPTGQ